MAGKPSGRGVLGSPHSDSRACSTGEACWWTMHPASKQRSEGEKVRVGDDLILVSVSSERYLVSSPPPAQVLLPPGGRGPGPPRPPPQPPFAGSLAPTFELPDFWHPLPAFGVPCLPLDLGFLMCDL